MREFDVESLVDYRRYSNRTLMAVPLVVLAIALVVLGGTYAVTGTPVDLGIEFTGGSELQITTTDSAADIRASFDDEVSTIQRVPDRDSYILTFQSTDTQSLGAQAEDAGYDVVFSQSTSPTFAKDTQLLAIFGIGVAFLGMSIIVFVLFRTFIPSLAVALSAFSDIVVPLALMNVLGIELTLGTVAALLMLIGYSVDSDILLTNHVLRRSGEFYESAYRAMETGVTMTLTAIAAMTVMAIVAFFFGIELLTAIGVVLVLGLLTDLMNTYMFNISLLRWYRGLDA